MIKTSYLIFTVFCLFDILSLIKLFRMMILKRIRLGQIGIGHNHAEAKILAARKFSELFDVIGYAEPDETWITRRGDLEGYRDLKRFDIDELIERCDAILIETDVWNLVRHARKCIDAGVHIHMDKPANGAIEEFKSLLDEAEKKKLVVQLGYMYRYNPAVKKTFELIERGKLGEIYSINAEMSTYHPKGYKEWLSGFKGGIMYILGSHLVDLVVYMLGEPEGVFSFLKRTGLDDVDFEDNNLAVLEYKRAIARIFVSSVEVNGYGRRQLVVSGSRGTVDIVPLENPCVMTYSDTSFAETYKNKKETVDLCDLPPDCRYDDMMRDFYAYCIGEKQNPFTYKHDYIVHKVLYEIIGGWEEREHKIEALKDKY